MNSGNSAEQNHRIDPAFHIVLHEPEIPSNTGNIGRTCMAAGSKLHLIEPLGFSLSEKALKRAGMDYWKDLDVEVCLDWHDFIRKNPDAKLYFATTKARKVYTDVCFEPGSYLVFGSEGSGLPEELLLQYPGQCMRIPMREEARSLNLANSVAVVLYEALRQNQFQGLQRIGELHRLKWKD